MENNSAAIGFEKQILDADKQAWAHMSKYSPGMRVLIRDEEWMIRKTERNCLDSQSLYCVGVSPLVKDRESIFIADLEDITPVNPADMRLVPDVSQLFKRSRLYIESQWRQQIPTEPGLYIGDQAAMDLMNFQLEPAKIALDRLRQRILIADSVGLGKTLEAGILMSELILRGKGKRILVVTVKSMMTQFQKEMWNRFTIPLVRLDSNRIQRIRNQLPTNYNPFFYHDKTIISMDTLKRDLEYRTHLENASWDIIVIDEAHNVAKRGGHTAQRARLASLLKDRSDTLILLTATPHDGRSESFASLIQMLEPTAIPDVKDYRKEDIQDLCIRRFKKDVKNEAQGAFQERSVFIEHCPASAKEERAYCILADLDLHMDRGNAATGGVLFKTGLEKSLFSSPAACIKTIENRLKKLAGKHGHGESHDALQLQTMLAALQDVDVRSFSRYIKLLDLFKNPAYAWKWNKDDRIVIFTERIETKRYIAQHLREDLGLPAIAVCEMDGSLSDAEQQRIVEDFGRAESPIRILVASDVASEGINLHYLSHRLIHFDIPWSLMVFQQRNGRIDRYGQKNKPDIRYLMTQSQHPKIKGDIRIMEILITKEGQAYKNIGDPALLMGKFNIEEEEEVTAKAIQAGLSAEAFEEQIDQTEDEFDPFEELMKPTMRAKHPVQVVRQNTLYKDLDYLRQALAHFSQEKRISVQEMQTVQGLMIELTPEMRRRLAALLPEETMPDDGVLRLSPDKAFCMEEMKRSLQNALSEKAWPTTQYLWRLHPMFDWVNDKAGLLFKRGEAPLIGLDRLHCNEAIFLFNGILPNRRSTSVVDAWFALRFVDGNFEVKLDMEEMLAHTGYGRTDAPNRNKLTAESITSILNLLPQAVNEAEVVMKRRREDYQKMIAPLLEQELEKLIELEGRHKEAVRQLTILDTVKSARERRVDELFRNLETWVEDTLDTEKTPYLRVIAAFTGVEA